MKKVIYLFISIFAVFCLIALTLGSKVNAQSSNIRSSFVPAQVSTTPFTVQINITPPENLDAQGYQIKINFLPSKVQVDSISYNAPWVRATSAGADGNDSDSNTLAQVNSSGVIKLIGQINGTPTPLNRDTNYAVASVTFHTISSDSSIIRIDDFSSDPSMVFKLNSQDFTISRVLISGTTLSVNSGVVSSPTPTPTPVPGAPVIQDVSGLPSCINGLLNSDQKQAAAVNWTRGQNSSGNDFWVDISQSSSFTTYYHKEVSGLSTDLTGFNLFNQSPAQEINIQPNITYFVRVFDPSNQKTSSSHMLNISSCQVSPTPTPTPIPGALACSDFAPVGLTDTLDRAGDGAKIFAISSGGGNRTLQVTRTPADATINHPSSDPGTLGFTPNTDQSGNWIANIPANPTTTDNTYSITTTITKDGRSANCPRFIIKVAKTLVTATTTKLRIAETRAGLDTATDIPYTDAPLTIHYSFNDKSLGDKKIWVKFFGTDTSGQAVESTPQSFPITIVSPDPKVDSVSCDLGVDNTVRFTVNGSNFGAAAGRNGSVKTGQTVLKIDSWSNTQVQGTLEQTGTTGQSFPVILTREDGIATDGRDTCLVATTALQLGANFFCRQTLTQTLSNVEVTLAEGREGGTVSRAIVTIGSDGLITGLPKFQQGKDKDGKDRGYRIGIKAPGSLRRVVEFIAAKGTTRLDSLELPFGDISPARGDGKVNSADYGEMIREWVVSQAATGERRADLNGDGRVNSFDWACMRPFFNQSDDSEPKAGPLSISASPSPGTVIVVTPTPTATSSATATPSASVSPTPTPTPTPSPSPSPVQ